MTAHNRIRLLPRPRGLGPRPNPANYPAAVLNLGKFGLAMTMEMVRDEFPVLGVTRGPGDAQALRETGRHPRRLREFVFEHPDAVRLPKLPDQPSFGKTRVPTESEPRLLDVVSPLSFGHLAELPKLLPDRKLIVLAMPSRMVDGKGRVVETALNWMDALRTCTLQDDAIFLVLTKGLVPNEKRGHGYFVSAYLEHLFPNHRIAYGAGLSFASGIAAGIPTGMVFTAKDPEVSRLLADLFNQRRGCIMSSSWPDPVGIQIAGVCKNIVGIGAGMLAPLLARFYDKFENAHYLYMTWVSDEVIALSSALGARDPYGSFATVAGCGDLFGTAGSSESRNNRLGNLFGEFWRQRKRPPTPEEMHHHLNHEVAEGYLNTREIIPILDRVQAHTGRRFPLLRAIDEIIHGGTRPRALFKTLRREGKRLGGLDEHEHARSLSAVLQLDHWMV